MDSLELMGRSRGKGGQSSYGNAAEGNAARTDGRIKRDVKCSTGTGCDQGRRKLLLGTGGVGKGYFCIFLQRIHGNCQALCSWGDAWQGDGRYNLPSNLARCVGSGVHVQVSRAGRDKSKRKCDIGEFDAV